MEYLVELERKIKLLLESLKEEFTGLRTNRPTPKLVEKIKADYMGQMLPIKQVASISVEAPRDLIVTPWDKSSITEIVKAVESKNLGVSVSNQGAIIRIKLPELTSERRVELAKIVKSTAEEARIRMRQMRDDVNKKASAEKDEDTKYKTKEELQKIVDAFNSNVDEMIKVKLHEIEH